MEPPKSIKILDSIFKIEYFDTHLKVDPEGKEELCGMVDYNSSTIRIFNGFNNIDDVFQILWHEILHALGEKLKIKYLRDDSEKADERVDLLAIAINTIIKDNSNVFARKEKKPRKSKEVIKSELIEEPKI
jgi:hypothetical protein